MATVVLLALVSSGAALAQSGTPAVNELFVFPLGTIPNLNQEGAGPGALMQASDGNFYGMTGLGGQGQSNKVGGTIFKITPDGQFTLLYTFAPGNPATPYANGSVNDFPFALVEGPDGYLYGTTGFGGNGALVGSPSSGYGTIFRISKDGNLETLHTFCHGGPCEEGNSPRAGLILARDGKFYGTTFLSGSNHSTSNGTIYRFSPAKGVETLHNFDPFVDGGSPLAGLVQGSDGNFYGTTSRAGSSQSAVGTVYRITRDGVFTVLHTFQFAPTPIKDGQASEQPLIQACHGKLYGVTKNGGLNSTGTIFEIGLDGSDYKSTYDFPSTTKLPNALLQASDGNFWGSTILAFGSGFYSVSLAGSQLNSIRYPAECASNGPRAPLTQATDGKLWGTFPICGTINGVSGPGSIFTIDAGLPKPLNPVIGAVTNAASFAAGGIVPGEIATIFGPDIVSSPGIHGATDVPLPTELEDVSVYVNGIAAPLFAVINVNGQPQINFQVPFEVAGASTAVIEVENHCRTSFMITVPVLAAQPGLFAYNSGGTSYGAILHANYQLVDSAHPAHSGETLLIYANGLGMVAAPPKDGERSGAQTTIGTPTVTIGGRNAKLRYSGLAPGFIGLNQINADVPAGLTAGNQPVTVAVDEATSVVVMLPVEN
ncbi:MAG TPA: choice-of-anchor tandem repeat GloVer-containing protein [Bryobacteraceae bacterium]|nr:choice-of-anchor tandem repeat GloVer-containing protein [Bryobacteraceae bacterium]